MSAVCPEVKDFVVRDFQRIIIPSCRVGVLPATMPKWAIRSNPQEIADSFLFESP